MLLQLFDGHCRGDSDVSALEETPSRATNEECQTFQRAKQLTPPCSLCSHCHLSDAAVNWNYQVSHCTDTTQTLVKLFMFGTRCPRIYFFTRHLGFQFEKYCLDQTQVTSGRSCVTNNAQVLDYLDLLRHCETTHLTMLSRSLTTNSFCLVQGRSALPQLSA